MIKQYIKHVSSVGAQDKINKEIADGAKFITMFPVLDATPHGGSRTAGFYILFEREEPEK